MAKEVALIMRQHVIIGDPAEVGAVLDSHRARGRLVGTPTAAQLPKGRIRVVVNLVEDAPSKSVRQRWQLWSVEHDTAASLVKASAFALAVMAVLALAGGLIGWLVLRNAQALAAGVPGLLVALAILVFGFRKAASRKHRCSGIHCSGCKG